MTYDQWKATDPNPGHDSLPPLEWDEEEDERAESDLSFVTNGTLDQPLTRSRKQHMADLQRECFRHKIKHLNDDCEKAFDFARDLKRSGEDVTEELNELICAANGLLLTVALLKREE